MELEVDSSLVDQPRELHARIAELFQLASESVNRELETGSAGEQQFAAANGAAAAHELPVRPATANQICAIHAIASRQNLDLTAELRDRFGVFRADDLTLRKASQLIEVLGSTTNGAAGPP